MKSKYLLLLGVFLIHFSCVKKEQTNQNTRSVSSINSKSYPIEIEIDEADSSYFEKDILIDLSSTEFLVSNFSGLLNYKVDDIQFDINNYVGEELTQCNFEIAFVQLSEVIGSSIYYTVPLYTFDQQGTFITVNHSPSTLSLVENIMNVNNNIVLRVKGTVSDRPVKFNSTFKIRIKISNN